MLLLVNKEYRVTEEFKPEDLVSVTSSMRLRSEAAEQLTLLQRHMKADGIRPPGPVSAYRAYGTQYSLHSNRIAKRVNRGMTHEDAVEDTERYTAPPGASEHQLGLAVDFSNDGNLSTSFQDSKQGRWLQKNSWRYGFVLRYKKEKQPITQINYEPWHFRYVGYPHSQIMVENNWCLEEYITQLTAGKVFTVRQTQKLSLEVSWVPVLPFDDFRLLYYSSDNTGGYILTREIEAKKSVSLGLRPVEDPPRFHGLRWLHTPEIM